MSEQRYKIIVNGCRYCGASKMGHCFRYAEDAGRHAYTPPTDEQRLVRLRLRTIRGQG